MFGNEVSSAARILVVEDSAATRQFLGMVLESAGYDVDLVETGPHAVEAARQHDYDLVLMDLGLPEMDGYAASAALRELPSGKRHVPVVVLTARMGVAEIDRCRRAGLDGYITKPFNSLKLIDELRRWTAPETTWVATNDGVVIWDRVVYREVADRLGPTRTEKALDMFEDHLDRSIEALRASPDDTEVVDRETHALVGIAGLLGFRELSDVSRRTMTRNREAGPDLRDLFAAADRALACLWRAPHSALV